MNVELFNKMHADRMKAGDGHSWRATVLSGVPAKIVCLIFPQEVEICNQMQISPAEYLKEALRSGKRKRKRFCAMIGGVKVAYGSSRTAVTARCKKLGIALAPQK